MKALLVWFKKNEFTVLGVLFLLATISGTISYMSLWRGETHPKLFNALYDALKLFVLDGPDRGENMHEKAPFLFYFLRFFSPILLGYTVVKTLIYFTRDKILEFALRYYKNHIIVCGIRPETVHLIKKILEKQPDAKIVIIEHDPNPSKYEKLEGKKIPVIKGDFNISASLKTCNVKNASYLLAISESDERNLNFAFEAKKIKQQKPSKTLECVVAFNSLGVFELFMNHPFLNEYSPEFKVKAISFYENAARELFTQYPIDIYANTVDDGAEQAHLLLCGDTLLVRQIITYYARSAHFLNGKKVKITLIDEESEQTKERLLQQFPDLMKMINLVCYVVHPRELTLEEMEAITKNEPIHQIIVALKDEEDTLNLSYNFRRFISHEELPIISIQPANSVYSQFFKSTPLFYEGDRIIMVNFLDLACDVEYVIREKAFEMAIKVHQNYVKRELEKPQPDPNKTIPWEKLPLSLKMANFYQVEHLPIKVRALGLELAELSDRRPDFDINTISAESIEKMAKAEHNRWNASRWMDGWMVGKRDNKRKKHNNLVDWEELDQATKQYDIDVIYNLPELARMMEKKLVKREV